MNLLHELSTYRKMLRVNKHRLDDELEIQADIADRIGQEVAARNSKMQAAKNDMALVEARLYEEEKDGAEKATEAMVKSRILRAPEMRKAFTAYQDARENYEQWQSLYEAWKTRGFDIKTLAGLYSAQYFAINSTQDNKAQDDHRRAMREARNKGQGERDSERPQRSLNFDTKSRHEEPERSSRRRLTDE